MKRKSSNNIKNNKGKSDSRKASYYSQGVPYKIIFKGKELRRVYQKNRKIEYSDLKEEGIALIDGDNYSLILIKDDINIIVFLKFDGSYYMDQNDKNKSRLWCYDYTLFYINTTYNKERPFKFYDYTKQNPYNIRRIDHLGTNVNIRISRSICDVMEPILLYNTTILRSYKSPGLENLIIRCDIRRENYDKFINNYILLLFLINIIEKYELPIDIYNYILKLNIFSDYTEYQQCNY